MQGNVRIIGGKWRGKKLAVPSLVGLRPTPDRVRETVFNWLSPVIANARCLDLCAGSGAFSFEALSRGALFVTMIDNHAIVEKTIRAQLQALEASVQATFYLAELPAALSLLQGPFNIIFIDPPYVSRLTLPLCFALEKAHLLAEKSYIYLEASDSITPQQLPTNWTILKAKKAGMVRYYLITREKPHEST